MPEPIRKRLLDEETIRQVEADTLSGKYADITLPPLDPLDPESDPFDMNYEWLDSVDEFADVYTTVANQFPSERTRKSAEQFREIVLEGSLATGTDVEILRNWTQQNFAELCRSSKSDVLEQIRTASGPTEQLTREVTELMGKLPNFDDLPPADQIAIALTVIDVVRGQMSSNTV